VAVKAKPLKLEIESAKTPTARVRTVIFDEIFMIQSSSLKVFNGVYNASKHLSLHAG